MGDLSGGLATGIGLAGTYLGQDAYQKNAKKGANAYVAQAQKGINNLEGSQANYNDAQGKYINAGTNALGQQQDLLANRTQADTPNVTDNTASNAISNYLNPSAAYTTAQSNNALQASALAGGGNTGGGLAKALSANASNLAMTNYNNAYNQMLQGNNQTFNQQQTNYTNDTNYQNQIYKDTSGLATQGLDANNTSGQINNAYGNSILGGYEGIGNAYNNMYTGIGNSQNSAWNAAGQQGSNATKPSDSELQLGSTAIGALL